MPRCSFYLASLFAPPSKFPVFPLHLELCLPSLGLRVAFAKHLWWPKWVLNKKVQSKNIRKLVKKMTKVAQVLQKVVHPRLLAMTKSPLLHRMNGFLVFLLAFILALPLPIPMSNLLAAFPILFLGLGLLEDDGVFILIGYFLTLICFAAFAALIFFAKKLI